MISEYNYSGVYRTILWMCIASAYAPASWKDISLDHGGGPISRHACGRDAAQGTTGHSGKYHWYMVATKTNVIARSGNQDGNTIRTMVGVGRIGMTSSILRYCTWMKVGWTSVLLNRVQLFQREQTCAMCVQTIFHQLEPNVHAFDSMFNSTHVLRLR